MRKQGAILVLATFLALILCSAVSAADSSDDGGVLPEQAQDVDGSVLLVAQSSQSVIDPVISVGVNYEISSDSGINPTISVEDSAGVGVELTKTYDSSDKVYSLTFDYPDVADGSSFKVIVSAPGYVTEEQQVAVTAGSDGIFRGQANFSLEATAAYKLGREVAKKADQLLNFATADNVLCITTAGICELNGETSEDCIEGILNVTNGKITYGKGNLLMLRKTPVDPVDFAFIIKKGSTLKAVCFSNSSTPIYTGTVSKNMEKIQWNTYIEKVGGTSAYSYASLANAWADNIPTDLLREAAFHGHMCQGTISGYSMVNALLKYYPPIVSESQGSSPMDLTSYKVIGVPGGSDDDAIMNFMNTTPGKGAYTGFDTSATGADENMLGIIRWDDTNKTGTLIVLQYNQEKNRQDFQTETGITLQGDLAEMKFNSWLLQKMKDHPEDLVTFVTELEGLTEEQYYYLVGLYANYAAVKEAHGLDMNYINSLTLNQATRAIPSTNQETQFTTEQIRQIGTEAATIAQMYFNAKGISFEKDDLNLAVLTSAGYVRLNGQPTDACWDGIYGVLGVRLSRSNLLSVHSGIWKPLWFAFVKKGADGQTLDAIYMRYDPVLQKLVRFDPTTQQYVPFSTDTAEIAATVYQQVNNIGPVALNDWNQLGYLQNNIFKDGNWFNIESIANAWRVEPPFDELMTYLFHDHACPGVAPGYLMSDYILENYPLREDESYIYMSSSIYCKDDGLIYRLGVSPGMGTYQNQRLLEEDTLSQIVPGGLEEGILIRWNEETKVGEASIITYGWPEIDFTGCQTFESRFEVWASAFISSMKNEENPRILSPSTVTTETTKLITEDELKTILAGGPSGDPLQYVTDLPVRSLSDLLPQDNQNDGNQNNNGDNNGQPYDGTDTSTGSSTDNSIGDSGLAMTATLQATAAEAGKEPGSTSTAHEITPVTSEGSDSSSWGVAAIVGVLVVLALGAFGFFWKGRGSA